jgi:hypothetical protein
MFRLYCTVYRAIILRAPMSRGRPCHVDIFIVSGEATPVNISCYYYNRSLTYHCIHSSRCRALHRAPHCLCIEAEGTRVKMA